MAKLTTIALGALTAASKRNYTLPSHYENCSLQQPPSNCWFIWPPFALAIETTTIDNELRAAWTCKEIIGHCTRVDWWRNVQDDLKRIDSIGIIDPPRTNIYEMTLGGKILAPLGLFLNALLCITLCSPRLQGRVYWYLRCVAFAQIMQAIEKITIDPDFVLGAGTAAKKGGFFVLVYGLTNLIDFFKQFAIAMSFFVALERFVSVCGSIESNNKAHKKYFLAALALSFLIGMLTMFQIYLISYDANSGSWATDFGGEWYKMRTWFHQNVAAYVLIVFDIASIILTSILTTCVIVRLMRRSRKVATMMSSVPARKEHRKMVQLCRMQALDAVVLVYDLCSTITTQVYTALSAYASSCTSSDCLFPSTIRRHFAVYEFSFQASFLFGMLSGFCHGEMFFLYLGFSQKFREAFVTVWGDAYKKVRSLCDRFKAVRTDQIPMRNF